jgi:hypothetical protein
MSGVLSALAGTLKPGFADVVWTSPTVFAQTIIDDYYIVPGGGGWYEFYYFGFYGGQASATLTVSQAGQPTPTISLISTSGGGSVTLSSQTKAILYNNGSGSPMTGTFRATGAGEKTADITLTLYVY